MRRIALLREQSALSLFEVMVAVSLIGAVVAFLGPVMTSSLRAGRVLVNESRAVDEIQSSMDRIDRELRSACEVSSPAADSSASTLTFKTQADRAGTYEVTYEAIDGQLTRTEDGTTQQIGEGLVVTSEEFTHTQNNTGTRAEIGIDIDVRFEDSNSPRSIQTVVSGRNTWSGCP